MEHLVRGDRVLDPGNLRELRPRAGGDEDELRVDLVSVELRAVRSGDGSVSFEDVDLVGLERLTIEPAETRYFREHVVAQGRPVERCAGELPAEAARVLQVFREMRAVDEQLLRHAAAHDAGAADPMLLDDRNLCTQPGRDARGAHAARSGADDQQVIVDSSTHERDL
jgi:hypothetical protein